MTPKEKAEELVNKYYNYFDLLVKDLSYIQAKLCALIAVDEILNNIDFTSMINGTDDYNYWKEVKQEIQKL